jgi:ABC-type sugar transport system ATPase subunit
MNLLPAEIVDGEIVALGEWRLPHRAKLPNGPVDLGLRPEALTLGGESGFPAEVFLVEPLGSEAIVHLRVGEGDIRVRVEPHARPEIGSTVLMSAKPDGIRLFDRTDGKALNA